MHMHSMHTQKKKEQSSLQLGAAPPKPPTAPAGDGALATMRQET